MPSKPASFPAGRIEAGPHIKNESGIPSGPHLEDPAGTRVVLKNRPALPEGALSAPRPPSDPSQDPERARPHGREATIRAMAQRLESTPRPISAPEPGNRNELQGLERMMDQSMPADRPAANAGPAPRFSPAAAETQTAQQAVPEIGDHAPAGGRAEHITPRNTAAESGQSSPPGRPALEPDIETGTIARPERFRIIRKIVGERSAPELAPAVERSSTSPRSLRPAPLPEQAVRQFYKSEIIAGLEQTAVRAERVSESAAQVNVAPKPAPGPAAKRDAVVRPLAAQPVQPLAGGSAPATPLREANVEPLVRHEAVAQAIIARAQTMQRPGVVEMRFALVPAELGVVRVRLEARGEQLRVELVASTQSAVETLNAGLSRLAANLHGSGFPQADVTLGLATSTHSGAQPQANSGDGGSGATQHQTNGSATGRDAASDEESAGRRASSRQRLDYTA
jgi:hypothetical protein